MIKVKVLMGIALGTMAFSSCDDTTDTLGNSLTNGVDHFEVLTDTFFVTTKSITTDSVLFRNQYSYLGRIKDTETGTYVTSNYTTQFAVLESLLDSTTFLPPRDNILSIENNNVIADSCRLQIYFYSSVGDSLNSMKLTAMELATPIEEGRMYYTNFDPEAKGMLRSDQHAIRKNKVYTTLDLNLSDSTRANIVDKTNMEYVTIPLNEKYYDKDGIEYKNYGTYIMRKYYENPKNFKNSYNFIHNVCPGFYIKSTDGLGVMSEVYLTELAVFYRYAQTKDSVINGSVLLSGTEEVMQTTNIVTDKKHLKELADDNTCTYLKTPVGILTEVTLPVDEIKYNHENDTISSAKIVFNAMNTKSNSSFDEPTNILMIPKDSLYSFFENKNLPNYQSSYLGVYNSTYNTYTFNNISSMISMMYNAKRNSTSENWNKVVLVPVSVTTTSSSSSSSSSITNISNDMSLKSAKLVGGSANAHDPIKISVIYNKFLKDN